MNFYNYQDKDPDIAEWGLAGRAQSWGQAQSAVRELLRTQHLGQVLGRNMKLRVWKNRSVEDWPWFIKWIPKEESYDHAP